MVLMETCEAHILSGDDEICPHLGPQNHLLLLGGAREHPAHFLLLGGPGTPSIVVQPNGPVCPQVQPTTKKFFNLVMLFGWRMPRTAQNLMFIVSTKLQSFYSLKYTSTLLDITYAPQRTVIKDSRDFGERG